ncbi:hypothetical protein L596_022326 [Steinernema carpocapsae]|uniref:Uncharacterized protein n=1 Tax=Steinernema carpocapsae TaxID=34508 RepID=A0A4U5MLS4_STECR|nr:hypothetical protein L596_022326 [Steinernema carpocapsae]
MDSPIHCTRQQIALVNSFYNAKYSPCPLKPTQRSKTGHVGGSCSLRKLVQLPIAMRRPHILTRLSHVPCLMQSKKVPLFTKFQSVHLSFLACNMFKRALLGST